MLKLRLLLIGCAAAALLIAPSQAAAAYVPGEYKGFNSQGGKAIMGVRSGKIVRYGQDVKMKCRTGNRVRTSSGRFTTRRPVKIGKSGRFSKKRRKGVYRPTISGRVDGNEVKGKFRLKIKRGGETCTSPVVKFTLRWFLPPQG
jgi:hypothetical protein